MAAFLEQAIVKLLDDSAAVGAIVGNKIYPWSEVPQGTALPYITYQRVTGEHKHHMTAAAGLCIAIVQFDCWANNYSTTKRAADAIRTTLQGYRGTVTGLTDDNVEISMCHLDGENDYFNKGLDGSETMIARTSVDYRFGYTESVPTFA